jgi:transcriptional regulator GlxA family with amidase domain
MAPQGSSPRRIAILAFNGIQALDLFGPSEVFSMADRIAGGGLYDIEVVGPSEEPLVTSSGIRVLPHRTTGSLRGPIDTLVVAGGLGVAGVLDDERLIAWIGRTARRAGRVASVCNGAFLLARAGLLAGRRATTHWASCAELRRLHPEIAVETDPIFVRDGDVYTSAGVTAGIDLSLALVEDDLGAELALETARWLVLFLQRPGSQSQFSTQLSGQPPQREALRELQRWIAGHLDEDLSVPKLSERAFMSPRNFARVFQREVGLTPAAYVEAVRLERARIALESSDTQIDEIARECGFGTVETLRRTFARRLGVSPSEYRSHFRPRLPAAA